MPYDCKNINTDINKNTNTNVIVRVCLREDDIWLPLAGPSSSQGRSLLDTTAAGENGHSWVSLYFHDKQGQMAQTDPRIDP